MLKRDKPPIHPPPITQVIACISNINADGRASKCKLLDGSEFSVGNMSTLFIANARPIIAAKHSDQFLESLAPPFSHTKTSKAGEEFICDSEEGNPLHHKD